MKKYLIILITVAAFVAAIFSFAGCADFNESDTSPAGKETFTVTYTDGDNIVYEKQVTCNGFADNPELQNTKPYYEFEYWCIGGVRYDFRPVTEDIVLTAKWRPVEYTVEFRCNGKLIAERSYTVENKEIELPPVIEKAGYTARWEDFVLNGGNITVNATYTAINYKINFYTEAGFLQSVAYTVEDKNIVEPAIPEKPYYSAYWENYTLDFTDTDVHAVYVPITYRISFYADEKLISSCEYDAEHTAIAEPGIPPKEHYYAEWEDYVLPQGDGNVRVNAVYTPIEYTVTFTDGVNFSQTRTYTVENKEISEPEIPFKEHYSGTWQSYELDFQDITVTAEYKPVTFTVEFFAEGELIARRFYDIENRIIAEPDIPAKRGYTSGWSPYRLEGGNIRVEAVYAKIPDPEATAELRYSLNNDGKSYSVTGLDEGFAGGRLVIPSRYGNLPITEIAASAFAGNENISALYICNGVTKIDDYAFQSCTYLTEIDFPDTLTEIGYMSFSAVAIKQIALPPNLKIIGARAFQTCAELESLDIPDSVEIIGNRAFSQCTSLKTIAIGRGVTKIDVCAFKFCLSAVSLTFADPEGWVRVFSSDFPDSVTDMTEIFSNPSEAARILCSQQDNEYYYEKR